MRKVILGSFVSADGVMQAPGGPSEDTVGGFQHGGWVFPYFDETVGAAMDDILTLEYELLLGRKTYDIFAAHWPRAEDSPDAETAKVFNRTRKWVVTSSRDPLAWNNSVALHDPVADIARIKKEDGPNILIQGSSTVVQALVAHELIDEITLLIFPVVLGKGKRLFGDDFAGALKLTKSQTSPSGVVINTYVPAGNIHVGSFELPE